MTRCIDLKLEEDMYLRLCARADKNGGSVEEEAWHILKEVLGDDPSPPPPVKPAKNLAKAIMDRFQPLGGVELELPPRGPMREPPGFD